MPKLRIFFLTLICTFFSNVSAAYEVTAESQIGDIQKALNTGRTANIRGVDYLWEKGLIYKIKNGHKRRSRGIEDIVKAAVSPLITTHVNLPKNCEQADHAQSRAIKLIKQAMAIFPSARYEYAFQAGSGVKSPCLNNASKQIVMELKNSSDLTKAKASPGTLWLEDDEVVLHILRTR